VTHEAAGWSKALQKWIFMPRKISKEKFEEYEDAKKGSNIVLLADEDFVRVQVSSLIQNFL
jgi:soluble calcium-activated nucleotidase 1